MWPESEHLMEVYSSECPGQETQTHWSGNLENTDRYLN